MIVEMLQQNIKLDNWYMSHINYKFQYKRQIIPQNEQN